MTAMSAERASVDSANPFPPTANATAPIRTPGSARTYEVREVLKGMGLRWDPVSYAWHGTLSAEKGALLGRQFGLRPQVVRPIEAFAASSLKPPAGPRPPTPRGLPHDSSKTRLEARLALPGADTVDEDAPVSRSFTLCDITSALPDDSREADERAAARSLRDLRARVKAARAGVSATPGAEEILQQDRVRAARFYAGFGITEGQFRFGVRDPGVDRIRETSQIDSKTA
jgi:hypothetical protein